MPHERLHLASFFGNLSGFGRGKADTVFFFLQSSDWSWFGLGMVTDRVVILLHARFWIGTGLRMRRRVWFSGGSSLSFFVRCSAPRHYYGLLGR